MDLEENSAAQAAQVQTTVDVALHKKALEQDEKVLDLIEDLPEAVNLPGVGGGVDFSA